MRVEVVIVTLGKGLEPVPFYWGGKVNGKDGLKRNRLV